MKTIRPIIKKEEILIKKPESVSENHADYELKQKTEKVEKDENCEAEKISELIKAANDLNKKEKTIEDVMNEVLEDNTKTVTFEITLTKRQYELYMKKGGICWLKKEIVGLNKKGKRRK